MGHPMSDKFERGSLWLMKGQPVRSLGPSAWEGRVRVVCQLGATWNVDEAALTEAGPDDVFNPIYIATDCVRDALAGVGVQWP